MAMQDKVHQPYRAQLIDGMEEIFRHAKDFGAVASYLSGAGSTLMAMVTKEKAEIRKRKCSDTWAPFRQITGSCSFCRRTEWVGGGRESNSAKESWTRVQEEKDDVDRAEIRRQFRRKCRKSV